MSEKRPSAESVARAIWGSMHHPHAVSRPFSEADLIEEIAGCAAQILYEIERFAERLERGET